MKKIGSLIIIVVFAMLLNANAKEKKRIPSVNLKDMRGKTVSSSKFSNDGKPMIVNFWATWCKPCLLELNNISEVYDDWVEETGVKLIAVSIDDSRSSKRVAPLVMGRDWEYEIYLDENSDFRRAMNVNNPPHTFLLDGKGNIVYEHNGYAPGDEDKLYEKVKKLVKK